MMRPFGWEGGTQETVTLRGWSPDTAGVSTGPGPERERQTDEEKAIADKARDKYSPCMHI